MMMMMSATHSWPTGHITIGINLPTCYITEDITSFHLKIHTSWDRNLKAPRYNYFLGKRHIR